MRSAFTRLERLEEAIGANGCIAYFKIGFYDNDSDREKAQERMKNEYLAAGHPPATHYIFINKIPGPTKKPQEEGFTGIFRRS